MAQTTRTPDVEAQRTAMKKLGFLVGDWSGEASVLRSPGQFAELAQTESAQFRLDGLVLVIEGVGRTQADGKLSLQASDWFPSMMKQERIGCEPLTTDGGLKLLEQENPEALRYPPNLPPLLRIESPRISMVVMNCRRRQQLPNRKSVVSRTARTAAEGAQEKQH
jgi:hypothetical protein